MPWELVPPPPPPHYCVLPDPKGFPRGTVIVCTQPVQDHLTCGVHWKVGVTWFWRDHVWRQVSPGSGKVWL
jgi:hypothetical protein